MLCIFKKKLNLANAWNLPKKILEKGFDSNPSLRY